MHQYQYQVIIATATLAWGVNLPAHLVIVKGTEYFDGKQKRYVDMPITDVLQMIGRAGRPQYDTQAVACVMVHDIKKNFYKKFLYDPFPVESSLLAVLPDHINAEIVAGTIKSRQEALDYLTWTYFFRRLLQNPTYYGLECLDPSMINLFLSQLVEKCMKMLCEAYCIVLDEDNRSLFSTSLGRIASFYYISHKTMLHLRESLLPTSTDVQLLEIIAFVHEFSELPVRHNEDILNGELAKSCPLSVDGMMLDSPHTKTFLLFQAHFSRIPLPSADYFTDLKSVLDQSIRVIQAMIDVSGEQGWLVTTLRLQIIMQMIIQARWRTDSPISTVPHLEPQDVNLFLNETPAAVCTLPGLRDVASKQFELVANILRKELNEQEIGEVCTVLLNLPVLQVEIYLCGRWPNNEPNSQIPVRLTPIPVFADEDYTLVINLHRLNRTKEIRVHSPKFPKPKDEGWFLTLGTIEDKQLLALKRATSGKHQLVFRSSSFPGLHNLTLYIISDAYLGLDQQYDIYLDVQISTEMDLSKQKNSK